jgi:hypothetical protein
LLCKHLDEQWDDPTALFKLGYVFMKSESIGLAYQVFKRASDLMPGEASIWHNIGKLYHDKSGRRQSGRVLPKGSKTKTQLP